MYSMYGYVFKIIYYHRWFSMITYTLYISFIGSNMPYIMRYVRVVISACRINYIIYIYRTCKYIYGSAEISYHVPCSFRTSSCSGVLTCLLHFTVEPSNRLAGYLPHLEGSIDLSMVTHLSQLTVVTNYVLWVKALALMVVKL
jgi:hypothetical protein